MSAPLQSVEISHRNEMLIYTTGLSDGLGRLAEDKIEFIKATMNRVVSQIPGEFRIRIINYDVGWQVQTKRLLTQNMLSLEGVVADVAFREGYLYFDVISAGSSYLIVNFAGSEIREEALLNDLHFIDTSLYYSNQQELDFLRHLVLNEENEVPAIYHFTSGSTFKMQVSDRRECYVTREGGELVVSAIPMATAFRK